MTDDFRDLLHRSMVQNRRAPVDQLAAEQEERTMPDTSVTTTVRRVIVVTDTRLPGPVHVNFCTRDIGATQGVTLDIPNMPQLHTTLIVHFRPGTRHEDSALEVARTVLEAAYDAVLSATSPAAEYGSPWNIDAEEFLRVIRAMTRPWDGTDPATPDILQEYEATW